MKNLKERKERKKKGNKRKDINPSLFKYKYVNRNPF
jgi:hypothetical protein